MHSAPIAYARDYNEGMCKAKDIFTNAWVYGYYVQSPNEYGHDMAHLIISDETSYRGCGEFWHMGVYEIDPVTVCRSIGRADKYGNVIFENDYVRTKYGRVCKVVWFSSPAHCGWDLIPIADLDCPPPDEYALWSLDGLEICGNEIDEQSEINEVK